MKSVAEVEKIILDLVQPLTDTELVGLSDATERILAEDISSNLDYPYWDNSAMDGYAVRFNDVKNASGENPVTLQIVEEIPAGYSPTQEIKTGETARIFTGAITPNGADTIVMQENTQRQDNDDRVQILQAPSSGEFIRRQGSFYQAGDVLLSQGSRINPPDMAILATAQCLQVPVVRKPKIAILSTGDELITPEETLQKGQIIDSNQYLLKSFLQQANVEIVSLGIVKDNFETLKEAIAGAISEADWVLSTGGVSVGEYDYVDRVLQELGGQIRINGVKMKPGKPLTVATFTGNKLYFGIPGNPVSTMVTCWRLLQTAIDKLSGNKNYSLPQMVKGISQSNLKSAGTRESYIWGHAKLVAGYYQFTSALGSSSSGNLINLAGVNALAKIPIGTKTIEAEEEVEILLVNKNS